MGVDSFVYYKRWNMIPPKTKSEQSTDQLKVGQKEREPTPAAPDKDRLRDIIVVIVTYPLTPGQRANETGKKHPWLEVLSLVLKAALAAYAIYLGR